MVGTPETRNSVTNIADLLVDKPNGDAVRLGDVAYVRTVGAPNVIRRDAVSRYVQIAAGVSGRDSDAVLADVHRRLSAIDFPVEYHAEVLGDFQDGQTTQQRTLIVAAASALAMFFLLQAALSSWRLAGLLFLTLPLGMTGGAVAAFAGGGREVSLGSLIGFLAVLGLAARNGVLLLRHYQHLQHVEGEHFGVELVLRARAERAAPILTTAATVALAFIPFALRGLIPGQELVQPMAVVVLGGLVTTTLVSLFVLPALYLRLGSGAAPDLLEIDLREPYPVATVPSAPEAPLAAVTAPSNGREIRRTRKPSPPDDHPRTSTAMMRWIVGSSIKYRFLVVGFAAALVFVGVGEVRKMPVDVFPEFSPPKVEIQTPALGLNSTEVESLITVPLEHALQGIPGLDVIRSGSAEQVSQIVLLFERGTDVIKARQLVSERITTVTPTLPSWSKPPMIIQPLSSTSRVMKIGVSSDKHSMVELSMIANWKIRQRLLRVPGVANTPIWGERKQMLFVNADPGRMATEAVSLQQLMTVTADSLDAGLLRYSNGAVIGSGGFVDTPNQRMPVRHKQTIVDPEHMGSVVLEERGGRTLRISDVADVEVGHQPLIGDAVINGGPGLMLIVEKLPWANTLEVTRGVDEALRALEPGLDGVEIDATIFRPANFIESAIDNLGKALLIGCLLMVLMLGAFLWSWRVALISVVAIPLSLVAAALVLYWRGTTINTMVLAGFAIALGDIVDDAIIDIENVVRRLRLDRAEGRRPRKPGSSSTPRWRCGGPSSTPP